MVEKVSETIKISKEAKEELLKVAADIQSREGRRLKCDRSISLVDCITIAMGETLSMPVPFARHRRELDAERRKEPFNTGLKFLEDLE